MQQSKRILFLDVLRALAVILMLQGHSISALGDFSGVDKSSFYYQAWSFIRGITAPLFIFTAGTVFTYLFRNDGQIFFSGLRVRKGLSRFVTLLTIGYLLNYPSLRIYDFADVTTERWLKFFSVDALHLIAFGILSLIILELIKFLTRINEYLILAFSAVIVLVFTPFVLSIEWPNPVSIPVASYFNYKTGSFFPLFPWLFYIFSGSLIGAILRNRNSIHNKKYFNLSLIAGGILLFGLVEFLDYYFYETLAAVPFVRTDLLLVIQRLSVVLFLVGGLAYILSHYSVVPYFVISLGRNSLLIYILHLILIYGFVLVPGLTLFLKNSLPIPLAILGSISIITIFTILSILVDLKKRKFDRSEGIIRSENSNQNGNK